MHAVSGISKKISNKIEFFEKGEKKMKTIMTSRNKLCTYFFCSGITERSDFLEIKTVQWTVPDVHRRVGGRKLM